MASLCCRSKGFTKNEAPESARVRSSPSEQSGWLTQLSVSLATSYFFLNDGAELCPCMYIIPSVICWRHAEGFSLSEGIKSFVSAQALRYTWHGPTKELMRVISVISGPCSAIYLRNLIDIWSYLYTHFLLKRRPLITFNLHFCKFNSLWQDLKSQACHHKVVAIYKPFNCQALNPWCGDRARINLKCPGWYNVLTPCDEQLLQQWPCWHQRSIGAL